MSEGKMVNYENEGKILGEVPKRRRNLARDIAFLDKYTMLLPFFSLKKYDNLKGKVIKLFHEGKNYIEIEIQHAPYAGLAKKFLWSALKEVSWYIRNGVIPSSGIFWLAGSISEYMRKNGFVKNGENADDYIGRFREAIKDLYSSVYMPKGNLEIETPDGSRIKIFAMEEKASLVDKVYIVEGYTPKGKTKSQIIGIKFPDWILNTIAVGYVSIIDFDFWDSLKTPISKRIYEILLPMFYASYKNGSKEPKTVIRYRKLCELMPLEPLEYLSRAKKQLDRAFKELVDKKFLKSEPEWSDPAYESVEFIQRLSGEMFYNKLSDWNITFIAGQEFRRQMEKEREAFELFHGKESIIEKTFFADQLPDGFKIVNFVEVKKSEGIPIGAEMEESQKSEFFGSEEEIWDFIVRNCLWKAEILLEQDITRKTIGKICKVILDYKIPRREVQQWCIKAEAQPDKYAVITVFVQTVKDYIKDNDIPTPFTSQYNTFEKLKQLLIELGYSQEYVQNLKQSRLIPCFIDYAISEFQPTHRDASYSLQELKQIGKQVRDYISAKFLNGGSVKIPYDIARRTDELDLNELERKIVNLALYGAYLKKVVNPVRVQELIKEVMKGKSIKGDK